MSGSGPRLPPAELKPVCGLAAAPLGLPLLYILMRDNWFTPNSILLDRLLDRPWRAGQSLKIMLFAGIPALFVLTGVFSLLRLRRQRRLAGRGVAIAGMLLNVLIAASDVQMVASLYRGYR
jgi:hypothetical protein